jgi:hypothetical protein
MKVKIYKTIILPLVSYVCETWSLTLKEEHRLSVFEYRCQEYLDLRERKWWVVGWRRLHNEELQDVYSSQNIWVIK